MKKEFNGYKDNNDARRPLIGLICRPADAKGNAEYSLINILVNGGKHDTYVLKNTKTGKIVKRTAIVTVRKARPEPFTKDEVWHLVASQTSKPAAAFRALIKRIEKDSDDVNAWTALVTDAMCTKHQDKMLNMISVSTSCLITCADNKMRDDPELICSACFSENQQDRQQGTREKLIRNAYLFAFHDIPEKAFMAVDLSDHDTFRLESFGDLMNATQFKNYLKLIRTHENVTFTEWTKKPWIMNAVFRTEDKPKNMIVILSAPRLNDTMTIEQARSAWWFVDKVFTVYTKEYIAENDIQINCGARECFTCRKCYEHNDIGELREIKK